MNQYTLEFREKQRNYTQEPIILSEYMMFRDHETMKNFIVAKLANKTAYRIEQVTFEITQCDMANNTICQGNYTFDKIDVDAYKSVVPMEKIEMDPGCKIIKVRLLKAIAGDKTWSSGGWSIPESIEKPVEKSLPEVNKLQITEIKNKRFVFPFKISLVIAIVFLFVIFIVHLALNLYSL